VSTDQESSSNENKQQFRSALQMLGLYTQSEFLASHTSAAPGNAHSAKLELFPFFYSYLSERIVRFWPTAAGQDKQISI
jgi:hypothetical protein